MRNYLTKIKVFWHQTMAGGDMAGNMLHILLEMLSLVPNYISYQREKYLNEKLQNDCICSDYILRHFCFYSIKVMTALFLLTAIDLALVYFDVLEKLTLLAILSYF